MNCGLGAIIACILLTQISSAARPPSVQLPTNPSEPGILAGSALRVNAGGRFLEDKEGRPFFWLGDTAWLLSQKSTRDEAELYLRIRAVQGFTVIQAALVMGEERVGGTLLPNVYGDQAFIGGNPARPSLTPGSNPGSSDEYDYWDHVDYIVERAAAHGLTLGVLPLFVGYTGEGYKYLTPEAASAYGLFIGERYGRHRNIVWILGGDNTPDTAAKHEVWRQVARGITVSATGVDDYSGTLMTFHVNGNGSSSKWVHDEPWLDFNMVQVWGNEPAIPAQLASDYARSPAKPTGLGEGSYEDGPQYPTRPVNALSIRRQAYWSYLAGGYHTYGNTNTWNFGTVRDEATEDWIKALDSPGARHLTVLARIFAGIRWWQLIPDPSIVASAEPAPVTHSAVRSTAGDVVLAYVSGPGNVIVRLDAITAASTAEASWIDPQTGARHPIATVPTQGTASFSPPRDWSDALLLIHAGGASGPDAAR